MRRTCNARASSPSPSLGRAALSITRAAPIASTRLDCAPNCACKSVGWRPTGRSSATIAEQPFSPTPTKSASASHSRVKYAFGFRSSARPVPVTKRTAYRERVNDPNGARRRSGRKEGGQGRGWLPASAHDAPNPLGSTYIGQKFGINQFRRGYLAKSLKSFALPRSVFASNAEAR
jgi:hypothetical protein